MNFKKFLVLAVSSLITLSLVSCTFPKEAPDSIEKKDSKTNSNILYVYNWGDYIDPSLLSKFEKETGITVKYDVYDTNEIMYQKLKSGNVHYDVIFPSDYMVQKMINEGMLKKIDTTKLNYYNEIDSKFKSLAYDPKNEFSVPYTWGTVGIIYNKTMVADPVDSWNILWNSKYKDNVIMVDSPRDAIGIGLKKLGYSLNSTNTSELLKARNELISQKTTGMIRAYMVDEVKDAMASGEAALAVAWSGDAITMMDMNPDLEFALPKEGSNKWFDAISIPKGSQNTENAYKFIDFLCNPENAAINAEYIGYSTPNKGALELLSDEIVESPVAYPSDEKLKNFEVFTDIGQKFTKELDQIWIEVKAARK
ncbi:MAG: ABC transporter substrate-binding protein [Sarcina sp.]